VKRFRKSTTVEEQPVSRHVPKKYICVYGTQYIMGVGLRTLAQYVHAPAPFPSSRTVLQSRAQAGLKIGIAAKNLPSSPFVLVPKRVDCARTVAFNSRNAGCQKQARGCFSLVSTRFTASDVNRACCSTELPFSICKYTSGPARAHRNYERD
jgi:hypothetical protein